MNIKRLIEQYVAQAFTTINAEGSPPVVKTSSRPEFGDYQINGIMGVAKKLQTNPRNLAEQVVQSLNKNGLSDLAEKLEIAGPGFINVHLKKAWLNQQAAHSLEDKKLGFESQKVAQTVVVDYSAPNLAKEMHVGHLRSTIIGDAMVRVLSFAGHKVIRQNHVGDWGTQFGMLLTHLSDINTSNNTNDQSDLALKLSDLEGFYQAAKKRFDDEPEFAETARNMVVKLQSGDEQCLTLWRTFIDISLQHCDDIYQRLNVLLERDDVKPESAYNNDLAPVVSDLDQLGLLSEDNGAKCVFLEEFKGKDDKLLPTIVQKSDGGYLYATSDLAALRYRQSELNADRCLYFVDARQSLHLQQVFSVARKANFVDSEMQLEHMPFGTMMGADGKPFKTREGGTVKLIQLLDEAVQRAFNLVAEKNPDLDEASQKCIAETVGIASVKYADLSKNRNSDYIFNWDTMLSFEGNTAPYLLYAYARTQSIFRKAENNQISYNTDCTFNIEHKAEHLLATKLLQFPEIIEQIEKDGLPNGLCNYLYETAGLFMSFYEACPILKESDYQQSRFQLTSLTAKTLSVGLDLLGIDVLERM